MCQIFTPILKQTARLGCPLSRRLMWGRGPGEKGPEGMGSWGRGSGGKGPNRLDVLGAHGGAGWQADPQGLLINRCFLIDAGTAARGLTREEAAKVTDVLLTHSHLDHIMELAFLIDNSFGLRQTPLRIHAQKHTIDALKKHIFNDTIWPDFSILPTKDTGQMTYHPFKAGDALEVAGLRVETFAAVHTVPTVGLVLQGAEGALLFSADSAPNPKLWTTLDAVPNLKGAILDLSFPERMADLATLSGHMCPSTFFEGIKNAKGPLPVYTFHAKPGLEAEIDKEIATHTRRGRLPNGIHVQRLHKGMTLRF